jgi:hypothetical protein
LYCHPVRKTTFKNVIPNQIVKKESLKIAMKRDIEGLEMAQELNELGIVSAKKAHLWTDSVDSAMQRTAARNHTADVWPTEADGSTPSNSPNTVSNRATCRNRTPLGPITA